MKRIVFLVMTLLSNCGVFGQINMLRYNDDFSYLKINADRKGIEKFKEVPLRNAGYISFGGEVREQLQYYKNRNFGDSPASLNGGNTIQLWHRVMVHTNLTLAEKVRVFVQLGSTFRFFNSSPLTPEIDENKLSLHQAFADYRFTGKWMLRLGRQEIGYGNHRLITFREGPNTRLAFDGVVIKNEGKNGKIDFIVLSSITSKAGVFDDRSLEDFVIGTYGTQGLVADKLLLDYYFLDFISDRRKYNHVSGTEHRQSYGFRLFSRVRNMNYEFETTYQAGNFNDLRINAYSLSADVTYSIKTHLGLEVGIGANYVSGDRKNDDNQLNTYNLLFSKPQYGLTAPIGSPNIVNFNPHFSLKPIRKLHLYFGLYRMWRQSSQDGSYSPLATQVRPSRGLHHSNTKEVGTQFTFESSYTVNGNLSFALDIGYFGAGKYVKETGQGRDITYLSFKGSLKF